MHDLTAAFDAVSHNILLARMDALNGVREGALEWLWECLKAYLNDCTQSVKIDKVMPEAKKLKAGITAQAFRLPMLHCFTFVVARKCNIQMHMYADDAPLYLPFNPRSYQAAIKQTDMKKYDHITPALIDLRWLPLCAQTVFKICVLVFTTSNGKPHCL